MWLGCLHSNMYSPFFPEKIVALLSGSWLSSVSEGHISNFAPTIGRQSWLDGTDPLTICPLPTDCRTGASSMDEVEDEPRRSLYIKPVVRPKCAHESLLGNILCLVRGAQ